MASSRKGEAMQNTYEIIGIYVFSYILIYRIYLYTFLCMSLYTYLSMYTAETDMCSISRIA